MEKRMICEPGGNFSTILYYTLKLILPQGDISLRVGILLAGFLTTGWNSGGENFKGFSSRDQKVDFVTDYFHADSRDIQTAG
jgi:hypothetical protein